MARELGLRDALSIGIGGMIGGGIFSVLGLAAGIAGPAVFLSFLLGGIIALLTGYSYVRLSLTYPSAGASYTYVRMAFGPSHIASITGWLLWTGYVVACALYAFTFGAYLAATVVPFFSSSEIMFNLFRIIFSVLLVFLFLAVNLAGVRETARTQNVIVVIKLIILLFFIGIGLFGLRTHGTKNLLVDGTIFPNGYFAIVIGCALVFISMEGFELIANASEELKDPAHTLPRAIMYSILIVIPIYVIASLVAVINMEYTALHEVQEYALAKAAEPILGAAGFSLVAIGALFSAASAFNASFYGSSRLSYVLGRENVFPKTFIKLNHHRVPARSLEATAILVCLLSIFGDLEQIASLASMIFLSVFIMVNISAFRLARKIQVNRIIVGMAVLFCAFIIVVLLYYLIINNKIQELFTIILFYLVIVIGNVIYKRHQTKETTL